MLPAGIVLPALDRAVAQRASEARTADLAARKVR
jgi:hypothetical protein